MDYAKKRKGFYHAWQRLVKHDPLFTKQRLTLTHLPNQATEAIEYAFQELGVKEEHRQSYIESHLLSYQVGQESCIIGHRHKVMMRTY